MSQDSLIIDSYNKHGYYTITPELMIQLNVCSLGWVIVSNVRSVTSVSLSSPELDDGPVTG
jgi:hypothetical protein